MTDETDATCLNCEYWERAASSDAQYMTPFDGYCHRWPKIRQTNEGYWCGEHPRRVEGRARIICGGAGGDDKENA